MAVVEPDMTAKKLTVTLAGQDAVGPLLLKRTYRISNGDLDYASELAAVVALGVLEGRWKAVKSRHSQPAASAGRHAGVGRLNRRQWRGCEPSSPNSSVLANGTRSARQLLDTPGVDALEHCDRLGTLVPTSP